jgi:hypothetical protein
MREVVRIVYLHNAQHCPNDGATFTVDCPVGNNGFYQPQPFLCSNCHCEGEQVRRELRKVP